MAQANNTVGYSFGYDVLNRLKTKTDSRGKSLAFTYDKSGRILSKSTYQNSTTSYTYDGAGRLAAITNPDYLDVNYQFDGAGRLLSRIMSSGAKSLYQYDANGQLLHLTHTDAAGATLTDITYTRDKVGNILTQADSSGTTTYTYDPLYRLTQSSTPNAANSEVWTYDEVGNWLTHTRGGTARYYNYLNAQSNRLSDIRIGSATGAIESAFTFDDEGRLTSQTGLTPRTLTWDAKGRLKTLTANGTTETYAYDPTDHRIKRSGGTLGNLDYYLEGEHLESVDTNGQTQEKYFRGSSIDELVAGYITTSTTNSGLTPVLFQHDGTMSVAAISDPNGGAIQTSSYSPFGITINQTGTSTSRLKYTGREDDQTGFYYYRARYYDKDVGRFISEDPLQFKAGINFYAYVNNNPVNANDPTGMAPNSWQGWLQAGKSAVGVIANAATTFAGGSLIGGGSAVAAVPTGVNQVLGYSTIALGSTLVGKGVGGVALNAQNFMDAWNNKPASMPTSLPRLIAESYAPGNKSAVAAADLIDFGTDLAALKVPVGGYSNSVGSFIRQNSMQVSNWEAATQSVAHLPFLTVAAPGVSAGTYANVGGAVAGGLSSVSDWYSGTACITCSAANGGFLLYPNKPNTNQMQSVYGK